MNKRICSISLLLISLLGPAAHAEEPSQSLLALMMARSSTEGAYLAVDHSLSKSQRNPAIGRCVRNILKPADMYPLFAEQLRVAADPEHVRSADAFLSTDLGRKLIENSLIVLRNSMNERAGLDKKEQELLFTEAEQRTLEQKMSDPSLRIVFDGSSVIRPEFAPKLQSRIGEAIQICVAIHED